ncbi:MULTISPECIES: hypothetical protein [Nitrosomonas]|uniref:TraB family protein n=1 Tax=Nitrosomonas communis TaxID=44574 RepID=A0A0F7KH57_9PROT|nr:MULTISPECIES: hypothetical protein [Nitrosomonas]AKH38458.1 hypothetical protein AAW31_12700 [Nitrosomonas communis]TYP87776.1 hypothetical protein BCL69_10238 [Nitrosomonas communis]UVS60490.1 hypothetical protein NX761_13370 [Nitrosomonas sp. PLL12]
MKVFLVGTSHSIQVKNFGFEVFLKNLCEMHEICSIAEEMSYESLMAINHLATIPQQLATKLGLEHRFCDPGQSERAKLGIAHIIDISSKGFLSGWSETEIKKRIAESHVERERYWMEQIQKLNQWPLLFVCGADHVESFRNILVQEDIKVCIAALDWVPTN